jgi:hypothetical protein
MEDLRVLPAKLPRKLGPMINVHGDYYVCFILLSSDFILYFISNITQTSEFSYYGCRKIYTKWDYDFIVINKPY